jgi:hypothetical protein
MSSTLNNLPFNIKIGASRSLPFPGAYIVRSIGAGGNGLIPIYTTISNFTANGMTDILNDKDAQVIVLPGYSLELYSSVAFGAGTVTTYNNLGGTDILFRGGTIAASSCKLYYYSPVRQTVMEVIP